MNSGLKRTAPAPDSAMVLEAASATRLDEPSTKLSNVYRLSSGEPNSVDGCAERADVEDCWCGVTGWKAGVDIGLRIDGPAGASMMETAVSATTGRPGLVALRTRIST